MYCHVLFIKLTYFEWKSARLRSSTGKLSSQSNTVSFSLPLQARPEGLLPGHGVPRHFWPTEVVALLRTYCLWQSRQRSVNIFPCSSEIRFRSKPLRTCRPSIFWLTMNFTYPVSTSLCKAMCVIVGCASSKEIFMLGWSPSRSSVHTPRGPRKSGIPADVLIPAPVWTTTCRAWVIQLHNIVAFASTESSSSNFYIYI